MNVKHVIVVGSPTQQVEDMFPHLDPAVIGTGVEITGGFTYVDTIGEVVGGVFDAQDEAGLETALLSFCKGGGVIYVAAPVETRSPEYRVLHKVAAIVGDRIVDEGLEALRAQVTSEAIDGPEAFEAAVLAAMDTHEVTTEKVVFVVAEETDTVAFHAPWRASKAHTIRWCPDGTVELDGVVLRSTALVGQGHFREEPLGDIILSPAQVVGFIAHRMALVGPEDLLGYGRAFGPGKEDQTNAALTAEGRIFRATGVVGVVLVTQAGVTKAKADHVGAVALALHKADPARPVFLHQQLKELYVGEAAMLAFRASRDGELVVLGGKSTKHTRVDAGAYCLYTEDGTSQLTRKAVIGNFECGNDGSIYAPKALMDGLGGFLRESVRVAKDFAGMTPALIARYFDTEVTVEEGDKIYPGDVVFTLNGVPQVWESKADYGIVTQVVDFASRELVKTEVHVNAWFVGDAKMRGFGKGLLCPAEAAGVGCSEPDAIIIGAAGIIKDSNAAKARMSNMTRKSVSVSQRFNSRDWELVKAKHNPAEDDGRLVKVYPDLCTLVFDDTTRTITTTDPNAVVADISFMIEAAPVGQAVGSSSMTMPQVGFLSSLEAGNFWLTKELLPGMKRRVDALTYLHMVAGQVTH